MKSVYESWNLSTGTCVCSCASAVLVYGARFYSEREVGVRSSRGY